MGGLVARAACHVASLEGSRWLPRVRRAIYIGTPHRGAPLERVGRVVAKLLQTIDDPYTQLIGQLANLRSEGIKDLGDPSHPVPLLPSIQHFLLAGTISEEPWIAQLFGDAMVPVSSATDGLLTAKIIPGVLHVPLAHHPLVYAALAQWCEATA